MLILQNEPPFNQKISYRCLRKHRKPFGLVHELGLHYREIYSSRYFLKHFTPRIIYLHVVHSLAT